MALTELNTYTVNDMYNLPDGQRAELIDGRVYYMAPATRNHQRIVGELFATIREHIRRNNFKGEVDITPLVCLLMRMTRVTLSQISALSVMITSWTREVAMVHPTGLLRWFPQQVEGLITPQNYLNTVLRECVNIGLWMQIRVE